MEIKLPQNVLTLLSQLEVSGYKAYAVGGCVRDALLGRTPHDWDICTSAHPEAVVACFGAAYTIPTGLKHGTVTVVLNKENYEVTTFRVDGAYDDGRRPSSVCFVDAVESDLARRDFTINAMAYHPKQGLVDPFGGRQDLQNGLLRCVGRAEERFAEDSLRIMRAIRFAAVYELEVEAATQRAAKALAPSLKVVSKERITAELLKLLAAQAPGRYLGQNKEVLLEILPELAACDGFEQNNPWHEFDVLSHILHAVDEVARDGLSQHELITVRLAALLHDVAKPQCYSRGPDGCGHFYGHPEVCAQKAKEIMQLRLRLPSRMAEGIETVIREHGATFSPTHKAARKWLAKLGREDLRLLVSLRKADILGHGDGAKNEKKSAAEYEKTLRFEALLAELHEGEECISVRQLAISGRDLLGLGIQPGPVMGQVLRQLLQEVLDECLSNEREALLTRALKLAKKQ